jgi:hypothetical protein
MQTLQERAQRLEAEGIFLGGPAGRFATSGRKLLISLLSEGLLPGSKVLDIGCGCVRGAYWLLHFLNPGFYFGIEPNTTMLDAGLRLLLEPGLADAKRPRFDSNADFNFKVFDEKFDFFVARSIWSHASMPQIEAMLDGFVETAAPRAVFLTSYLRATWLKRAYRGTRWVGRSHESAAPGVIRHRFSRIQAECARRRLEVSELNDPACNFGDQTWLRIKRRPT